MWEKDCGQTGIILETGQLAQTLSLSLWKPASFSPSRQWQWCCQTKLQPTSVFSPPSPHLLSWLYSPARFSNASFFSPWFPHRSLPPGCSGRPASPSWAGNIKEARSWNPAHSRPTAASSEPGAALLKQPHQGQPEYRVPWSAHGSVSEADRASYGVITAV